MNASPTDVLRSVPTNMPTFVQLTLPDYEAEFLAYKDTDGFSKLFLVVFGRPEQLTTAAGQELLTQRRNAAQAALRQALEANTKGEKQ